MTEMKQPQVGEWWFHPTLGIRYCVGISTFGDSVFQRSDGLTHYPCEENWRHEQRCKDWDWVEPAEPPLPRYFAYVGTDPCFWEFVKVTEWGTNPMKYEGGIMCRFDGTVSRKDVEDWLKRNLWKEITEDESKSLMSRKLEPLPAMVCPDCGERNFNWHEEVCPMAWVTQDRVPVRPGIDFVRWSLWEDGQWAPASGNWTTQKKGDVNPLDNSILFVRCRRKDLPPTVEQEPQTVSFFVPERAFDEPDRDFPVRCSLRGVKDVASWVKVSEFRKEKK